MTFMDFKAIIEATPITPMQDEMSKRILRLVPDKLKNNPNVAQLADSLKEEIEEDFIETIKKLNGG